MSVKYLFRLLVGGLERHVEVVCQRHYDKHSGDGGFFGPLSAAEKRRRNEQRLTPYTGNQPCAMCDEEAKPKGTAA